MGSPKDPPEQTPDKKRVYDTCPHCGTELSPWQKVLLSVDRALMCKHCWYRIILDVFEDADKQDREDKSLPKDNVQ